MYILIITKVYYLVEYSYCILPVQVRYFIFYVVQSYGMYNR